MVQSALTIPALRGNFGDWIYYSCLIPISEVGARVSYADEIHPDKALSQLIQRSLEGVRARHIADYLSTEDRFFNSLVLATYGGSPDWLEVGDFRSSTDPSLLSNISDSLLDSIGFLRLSGKEKIFAVDGQHRLAGIRLALKEGQEWIDEVVPVILVGHRKTKAGMRRTRRLFTTLNKTAVPVRKKDIIALDEDDVMAITVRRLVEEHAWFKSPKIAVIASQSLPTSNTQSLTTIASLYDNLKILFMHKSGQRSDRLLRFNRPTDAKLDDYYSYALTYFDALSETFPSIKSFLAAKDTAEVVKANRGDDGGHFMFRPVGFEAFTRATVAYAKDKDVSITDAVSKFASLPTKLSSPPHRDVIWDSARKRMMVRGKSLSVRLLTYMSGVSVDEGKLLNDYRSSLGVPATDTTVTLPSKL